MGDFPLVVEHPGKRAGREESAWLCALCRRKITSEDQALEVNGLHRHTFFNPAGLVFEIGCFSDAQGCRPEGPPSTHFSWFAGTCWQIALCRGCDTHLGWLFQGTEERFYGLIINRLVKG